MRLTPKPAIGAPPGSTPRLRSPGRPPLRLRSRSPVRGSGDHGDSEWRPDDDDRGPGGGSSSSSAGAPVMAPPMIERGREAGPPRGFCPNCHVWRADCFLPGDWACPSCGNHNYQGRTTCPNARCKGVQNEVFELNVWQEEELRRSSAMDDDWCQFHRTWKRNCFKPNDWCCPWCAFHNFARKEVVF